MEKDSKQYFIALLVAATFLGAVGQLLLKYALLNTSIVTLSLFIILGFIVYMISSTMYLYVLGRMHLSWAYGFGGLSYIFAALLAMLVLGEPISSLRWAGIIVIAVGTALVGLS